MIKGVGIENWLNKLTRFVMLLFLSNLLFMLSNFFLIFTILFVPITYHNSGIFIILFILTSPAITALFYTNWKYLQEGSLDIWRNYWKAYRQNFIDSIKVNAITTLGIFLFLFNFIYVKSNSNINQLFLIPIVFVLFILIAGSIYQCCFLSRFYVKPSSLLVISCLYCFKEWILTMRMVGLFFLFTILSVFIPASISCTIFVSLFIYLCLLNMQTKLIDLEKQTISIDKGE